jgi:hypothetical protein
LKVVSHQLRSDDAIAHFLEVMGGDAEDPSDDFIGVLPDGCFFVLAPENTPPEKVRQLKFGGVLPRNRRYREGPYTIERTSNCADALAELICRNLRNQQSLIAIREPYLTGSDNSDIVKELTNIDGKLFKIIAGEEFETAAIALEIRKFTVPWSFLLLLVDNTQANVGWHALIKHARLIAVMLSTARVIYTGLETSGLKHSKGPYSPPALTRPFAAGYCLRSWQVGTGRRLRGGLDLALHKPANIAHGDGEIVLSLQVDPELRSVTEISAET